MEKSLETLLNGLYAEGRLDSTGTFSIDLERALARIGVSTLSDSRQWILKAIQSAVALGASKIDINFQPHRITLRHDGEALSAMAMTEGLSSNPRDEKGWAKRELMVAIQTVGQIQPSRIEIITAYDSEPCLYHFDPSTRGISSYKAVRLDHWPWERDLEGTCLVVEFDQALTSAHKLWMTREIGQRGLYCPATLMIDGCTPQGQCLTANHKLLLARQCLDWSPWALWARPAGAEVFDEESGRKLTLPPDFSGVLCHSLTAFRAPRPGVHFVHLGILLDPFPWQHLCHDDHAWMAHAHSFGQILLILSSQGETLDASGQQVVVKDQGEAFLTRLRQARRNLQHVLRRVDPGSQVLL